MHKTGTFKQPVSITIDLSNLLDKIQETLQDLIIDYMKHTTNVDVDDIDIEFDGDDLIVNNIICTGEYSCIHSNATLTEPAYDDEQFSPDLSSINKTDMTIYINQNAPEWLKNCITVRNIHIDINDIEISNEPTWEPDWDTMPGGHDDI